MKRAAALKVVTVLPPGWQPDDRVPKTRGDCLTEPRPCTHVWCRHHLWLQTEIPGRPWYGRRNPPRIAATSDHSCALDVVDANPDGIGYTKMGAIMGIGRRRANQIGDRAIAKLDALREAGDLKDATTAYPLIGEGNNQIGRTRGT